MRKKIPLRPFWISDGKTLNSHYIQIVDSGTCPIIDVSNYPGYGDATDVGPPAVLITKDYPEYTDVSEKYNECELGEAVEMSYEKWIL